jgi:hypothetical protein
MCVSFMDLLKELHVGDPLLVVGNDVLIFNPCESVAVFEVAVGVLMASFITYHPHSGKVASVARTIIDRLVVGCEKARQCVTP